PVFSSGDVVSGRVLLDLFGEVRVSSLKLHAEVSPKCTGRSPLGRFQHRIHAELQRRGGVPEPEGGAAPGRHEFPFSFQLPEETLVTSFEGKHGSIRYWVKVKLHRRGPPSRRSRRISPSSSPSTSTRRPCW
ncbi:unnamed protein product, partial [Tetraodon nigroviridis]